MIYFMKTIMVIDDENDVLENIKTSLETDEFEVTTVSNSKKALELMEGDNENRYGLILIDTSIPGSNKEGLFSLKPRSKMDIDTSNEDDFLEKPFTKDQLIDFVKRKL